MQQNSMPTPQTDLLYLQTSLPELKNYLLSDILYYPLDGNLPRLTIGGILISERRLRDEKSATHLIPKLAAVKSAWRVAWMKKSARELEARLRLWRNYLNDYRKNPKEYASDYKHEIHWRVMIELLSAEVEQIPAEIENLDHFLRVKFISGEFIWDENLKKQFPEDKFWFLYGKLK